jgi:hypothetical protein
VPDLLATVRPDSVSVALLLHVGGAMILLGGLVTAAAALVAGWRTSSDWLLRFGYRSLLLAALPGWALMRLGAFWTVSREHLPDGFDPAWLTVGFVAADLGGLLLLASLVAGGVGVRRLREGGGAGLLKASTAISLLLIGTYVVAVWAMAGKPG